MTLESIHIKNRGPLVDFKAEFAPITVIYGPNASGKSLLSNTLRAIERGEELETGEAEVTFKDSTLISADFAKSGASNRIRVFNANFLRDDVIDGDPSAIVLGSEVNKQRIEIDRLNDQLSELESDKAQVSKDLQRVRESLGDQHQVAGELIRTVLRTVPMSEGANPRWPVFNRGDARESYQGMVRGDNPRSHYRSSDELDDLAEAIRQRPSNLLSRFVVDAPDLSDLRGRATTLLQVQPGADSLPEVDNDPGRRDWLLKGHGYASSQGHCAYCLQVVPPERAKALGSYFSNDMTRLLGDIDDLIQDVNHRDARLRADSPPDIKEVRSDRQSDYQAIHARWRVNIDSFVTYLGTLRSRLESKKSQPATVIEIEREPPLWDTEASINVNLIIDEHNQSVNDLVPICREYELGVIANRYEEWNALENKIAGLKTQIEANDKRIAEKTAKLGKLKHLVNAKLTAAFELTRMVRSFLGHEEVGFELNENGRSYQLTRHGEPATDFSEGERTALALMYFLKRLEDESFEKRAGTLVFDDPITSFDEDNLYRAVADIITMTGINNRDHALKKCNIIFLTHHFGLFERLWMELRSGRDKGTARFFEMHSRSENRKRETRLIKSDNLPITDYTLAFSEVKSMADGCRKINNPETSIRKCVEGFLTRMAPGRMDQGLTSAYWSFVNDIDQEVVSKEDLQLIISIANGGSHLSALPRRADSERHWSTLETVSTQFLRLMKTSMRTHHDDLRKLHYRRIKQEARTKQESNV